MPELPTGPFPVLLAEHDENGAPPRVTARTLDDLPEGDVVVEVSHSSVNYKDGLASRPDGQVARISPIVPGVDLSGTVVEGSGDGFGPGSVVLAHGYEIGVARHGGFARYARVPAGWVVPLDDGLSPREAMTLGTAGFTAAMAVIALMERGLDTGDGPVVVTGATGGVGSSAVSILATLGFEVTATTGKPDAEDWLRALGASDVIGRHELETESKRPLERQRWAGCVDCVGGTTLATVLRTLRYGAPAAATGLTGGPALLTTVLPFILRAVSLLGIDSVEVPIERRREIWARLAGDLRPDLDRLLGDEVGLDGLPAALERTLAGGMRGRTVVRLEG